MNNKLTDEEILNVIRTIIETGTKNPDGDEKYVVHLIKTNKLVLEISLHFNNT